ncbi:PTS mannitol transporter subunit IICB [Echinimonas agarilytica]|uniref:PTS mannitol transporter subunit IICB n=1 Tax=Echinimonas agarilytica TaxID=1215918 RepID=UPI002557DDA8|nr:PTS mannitol transporter subunit IICBA [Echinimonas agarilytica]
MLNSNTKSRIQSFGRFLSNMVMPNIAAFIAWGFITALFIPSGWLPNATLAVMIDPMITYMLPLLIGYTGGKLIAAERGGVVGAVTTMGCIVGSDDPMFLGAMIAGPLAGWVIKTVDSALEGKVKSGFEMLVNNFSAGIVGMLLSLLALVVLGPLADWFAEALAAGVDTLVQHNLLPLTSILVEPAKVLFLNNAINHGIFSPISMQQASEVGQSIFFLIESNPGPGLGVLLAYSLFSHGLSKQTAPGAIIIQFFGGIHEVYFPYVLMNPRLLLAVIAGGATGVATMSMFNAGLVSPASPGSIFAILLMSPKSSMLGVVVSIVSSTLVSFIIASFFVKRAALEAKANEELGAEYTPTANTPIANVHTEAEGSVGSQQVFAPVVPIQPLPEKTFKTIVVACDAGMGSSAMGANLLRKKVVAAALDIDVRNMAIDHLTDDIDIIITHQELTRRAINKAPSAEHLSLSNFTDDVFYDDLISRLKE